MTLMRCLSVCVFLCAGGRLATASDADAGRQIAQANCSPCHAIGPEGASPLARAPAFRTLHEKYPVEFLEEALAEGIVVGHSPMPTFVFTPPDIGNLVAYLKTLEGSR